jgi:tetratricopeptide (TPR) repeat protein
MAATVSTNIGLQFARDEKYEEAINEFTSLLSQDQTSADVYFYRGCAYLHLGQYEKAIDDFSLAIQLPNHSSRHELAAIYKRGYAYYKTNRFEPALDDYRYYIDHCKANQQHRDLHKGFFQLGIIYAALNENNLAIKNFTDAIESSEDEDIGENQQKLYYLHRGRAYACVGKYDEAQVDLYLVISKSNDLFIKGCAYNELGQHQNALKEFNSLLQSNENKSKLVQIYHDHILFRQGLSYASLNLHDQAINHFQSALEHSKRQNSSDITNRILFRKGMSNIELNHLHRALIDFNKSIELNNYQSDAFYARGMLHYKLGRYDAAVYDQRKAMELKRESSPIMSVYPTFYHKNKYDDNYMYYENKICEAEELLKKYKGTANEPFIHHHKAHYSQNQAPYSNNPLASYQSARNDIMKARMFTNESPVRHSVTVAINSFLTAHYLAEKYSTGEMLESAIKKYIDYTVESILYMSNLFDECVKKKQEWDELVTILHSESDAVNQKQDSKIDMNFIMFINNQFEKADIIQERMKLFADSPAQQEFYGLLFNHLSILFDALRLASADIFSIQLQGTFTKVSLLFKLLGQLFQFVPVVGQYGSVASCVCETGFKALDETRIESILHHLGRRCNPVIANQMADAIATEITKIYENQIKRFPTALEEETDNNNNHSQKQSSTVCSTCVSCCSRCWRCLKKQKSRLLNDIELLTIETIVEYGSSLVLSCLVRFESSDIRTSECIQNMFINGICRPPKIIAFYIMALADKIKPKDAKNDKEYWDTYDFFRRPVIDFENGTKRAQKETDLAKFGCRKATSEEKDLLEKNPERLNEFGFKIII